MEELINHRRIRLVSYSTERNWLSQLPNKDWLCVFVVNQTPRKYTDEVIPKLLIKDVSYICSIGRQSEQVHDLIDEEICFREVEGLYLPKHSVITTWHEDFEEGIWFSIFSAKLEEVDIKEIVILDMTFGKETSRVETCLNKIMKEDSKEQ